MIECGVLPMSFELYNAGIAPHAGITSKRHSYDFDFRDKNYPGYKITSAEELKELEIKWFNMTQEERENEFNIITFKSLMTNKKFKPISELIKIFKNASDIHVYCGAPLTGLAQLAKYDEIIKKITFICLMAGSWDGSKNLLGTNFNNAVDIKSSMVLLKFVNAIIIMVPTETCKEGPFKISSEVFNKFPASKYNIHGRKMCSDIIKQWTDKKNGAIQPLFDTVILMNISDLISHAKLYLTDIKFVRNEKEEENSFLAIKMVISKNSEEPISSIASLCPGNIYTVGRGDDIDQEGCAGAYSDIMCEALCWGIF
jgi:hypothetical protein